MSETNTDLWILFGFGLIFLGAGHLDLCEPYVKLLLNVIGIFCLYKSITGYIPEKQYNFRFDNLHKILIVLSICIAGIIITFLARFPENMETVIILIEKFREWTTYG